MAETLNLYFVNMAHTSRMTWHLHAGDMDVNVHVIPAQSCSTFKQFKLINVPKLQSKSDPGAHKISTRSIKDATSSILGRSLTTIHLRFYCQVIGKMQGISNL